MAIVIAVCNAKGGTGKTTSVGTIGTILAKNGHRTLLVDLDTQVNLTYSFIDMENNAPDRFLHQAIREIRNPQGRKDLPQVQIANNLYIVPSCLDMLLLEYEMNNMRRRENILSDLFAPVLDDYDVILLDCPPALNLITLNAFVIADRVTVPMTADQLSYLGIKMIKAFLESLSDIRPDFRINDIFFTMYDPRPNLTKKWELAIRDEFGDVVMHSRIRNNVKIKESVSHFQSVVDYNPESNGAMDYLALVNELIERINADNQKN